MADNAGDHMSQLTITGQSTVHNLNVIAFQSPVYGQINSVQTKTEAVHFPIKLAQPSMQLDVQFANETDFETFQKFVRNHQTQLSSNSSALLTLNWPERSIINNTGFIPSFKAGGMRWNVAPRARFEIALITSMASGQTDLASTAANWQAIYGGLGGIFGGISELAPPTAAQIQQNLLQTGINLVTGLPVVGAAASSILSGSGI
jgi:hypothetical protein